MEEIKQAEVVDITPFCLVFQPYEQWSSLTKNSPNDVMSILVAEMILELISTLTTTV